MDYSNATDGPIQTAKRSRLYQSLYIGVVLHSDGRINQYSMFCCRNWCLTTWFTIADVDERKRRNVAWTKATENAAVDVDMEMSNIVCRNRDRSRFAMQMSVDRLTNPSFQRPAYHVSLSTHQSTPSSQCNIASTPLSSCRKFRTSTKKHSDSSDLREGAT